MNRLTHWIMYEAWIVALELLLVAALAIGLAYWTWVAFGPRAAAAPSVTEPAAADWQGAIAKRHLFGVSLAGDVKPASRASTGLVLLGVFSGREPGSGRAILASQGSKPASIATGESLADDIVLREVHPDHVIILRNGAPERVDLERRASQSAAQLLAPARAPVRK